MNADDKQAIEKIMAGMKCPKDFKCVNNDFKHLCKAADIGIRDYVECLDRNPLGCWYGVTFNNSRFCKCPIRIYLFRDLGI
jgi:hypothetical protein